VRPDASHYELFYLRPGNSEAGDQAMRNHAVQYVSEPGFGRYRLRREWPWVYDVSQPLLAGTGILRRDQSVGIEYVLNTSL
jgi:hypothetical protein